MDFTAVNQIVTIHAGSTQVPINIPIVDDNLQENSERFNVIMERVTMARVTISTPNPIFVLITDNDG